MDPNSPGSLGRRQEPAISMPPPPTGEVVRPSEGAGPIPSPGSSWGPWSEGHQPGSTTRRTRRWLVVLLATLLVVGGGGSAAAFLLMRGAGEELFQLVPASSGRRHAYSSVGWPEVNLMALATVPRASGRSEIVIRRRLARLRARGHGRSQRRLRPWLALVAIVVDVGANVDLPTVSFLVASKDDEAAREALDKALQSSLGTEQTSEYRGAAMHIFGSGTSSVGYVIVDHVVVLSNHSIGLTRVIDLPAGSALAIADDPAFQETLPSLPEGKLGLVREPTEIGNRGLGRAARCRGDGAGLDQRRAIRGVGRRVGHTDGLAFDSRCAWSPKLDPARVCALTNRPRDGGRL